jgi:uncharacterized protein (TIGR02246 family)
MDRRQTILGLMAAASLMSSEIGATMPAGTDYKVRRLAELYAAAWNESDMDAMSKLYASDVHWVNIVGMHWQGKAQVDHAHRVYFDLMFKGVPLGLEAIESVVPKGDELVIAHGSNVQIDEMAQQSDPTIMQAK